MTILSDSSRNDYIGNDTTDTYSYTFRILSASDLTVTQRSVLGTETTLTLNIDYTVTGVGSRNGGTIVLSYGNLATGIALTIRRVRAKKQETDFRNQGDFYAEVHEDALDSLVMIAQDQQDQLDRSIKISETYGGGAVDTTLPGPQADKVIGWDAGGTALVNKDPGSVSLAIPADGSVTGPKIASGTPFVFPTILNLAKGADVASANALVLGSDGNYFDITGTTAITSIGTVGVGTQVLLQFDGILTFTHHATDLILPGAANITTAAGDHALVVEYTIGKWRCVSYVRASSLPVVTAGTQTITGDKTFSGTNTHSGDNTFSNSIVASGGVTLDGTNSIKVKIINIGDWDMDTTTFVTVSHGLTLANMRSVCAIIRNDADDNYFPIPTGQPAGTKTVAVALVATATYIQLQRETDGMFDSVEYDSTSYNRGWITITYVA